MEQIETLSEEIKVRVSPSMMRSLQKIAGSNPLTSDISPHVRLAISKYIDQQAEKQAQKEVVQ